MGIGLGFEWVDFDCQKTTPSTDKSTYAQCQGGLHGIAAYCGLGFAKSIQIDDLPIYTKLIHFTQVYPLFDNH